MRGELKAAETEEEEAILNDNHDGGACCRKRGRGARAAPVRSMGEAKRESRIVSPPPGGPPLPLPTLAHHIFARSPRAAIRAPFGTGIRCTIRP